MGYRIDEMRCCSSGQRPARKRHCSSEGGGLQQNNHTPLHFLAMAAPLIVYQEDGTYQVHDDGAALLSQLTRKIAVIVVAGTYRTGKSFLLNQLTGQKGTFSVGHTVESHTRGIWVCAPGLVGTTAEGEECDIVFMDSEGLASTDKVSGAGITTFGSFGYTIFALGLPSFKVLG